MNEQKSLKRTVLHPWHVAQNGNMAGFGGYDMPLWYATGAKTEHLSVIKGAGMFDTSHMAVVIVSGEGSFNVLQHCFTKDLSRCVGKNNTEITPGKSVYGLFLKDNGTVLDDAIVSLLGSGQYMIVVNSGMGAVVAEHLRSHAEPGVTVSDLSDTIGKIDIQGPDAARIVEGLFSDPDTVLNDMVYFSFKGDIFSENSGNLQTREGIDVLLSRTGYTGEFGFELFASGADTVYLWERLLEEGAGYNLTACGLASRDSLRAGALLPLSHQDIGDWVFANTPWSFVLPWDEKGNGFSKSFIGAERVREGSEVSYTYGFAGFDPRKITVSEQTRVLDQAMNEIGVVLTCTTDMAIGRVNQTIVSAVTPESGGRPADFKAKGLACGFVRTSCPCQVGDTVFLSEGKRKIEVEIRDDVRPDRTARRPMQQMRNRNLT